MKVLSIKFKSNNVMKSKAIKYIADKILLNFK